MSSKKERCGKRERIATLIRERAGEKKRLLQLQSPTFNLPNTPSVNVSSLLPLNLTPVDPRFFMSKIILDSMNTCEIAIVERCTRKHCIPEVVFEVQCVNESTPDYMGPKIQSHIGIDIFLDLHAMWFKASPDHFYSFISHSAIFDRSTGIATSSTEYTAHYTVVLERSPLTMGDEDIKKQEKLKRDEQLLKSCGEFTNDTKPEEGDLTSGDTNNFAAGDINSYEIANDIDWNDPEIDSFLDHIALDDDTLFFDSSHEVEDKYETNGHSVVLEAPKTEVNNCDDFSASPVVGGFTSNLFDYEYLQSMTAINTTSAATNEITTNDIKNSSGVITHSTETIKHHMTTRVKNIETCHSFGTFSVDIGKDGKVNKMSIKFSTSKE